MVGQSKVLCNGRGDGEQVSVGERSSTAGIRRAVKTGWEEESRRDVGAGIYKGNDGSDWTSIEGCRE